MARSWRYAVMSRATGAVRFQDGTVKWCLYNGTADILIPRLFEDPHTPWDAYYAKGDDKVDLWPEPVGEPEPVTIYSDYGGGWTWPGMATRNVVTEGTDPYEYDDNESNGWNAPDYKHPHTDGRPDWYHEAYRPFAEKWKAEHGE
jgi:hypothetical protein